MKIYSTSLLGASLSRSLIARTSLALVALGVSPLAAPAAIVTYFAEDAGPASQGSIPNSNAKRTEFLSSISNTSTESFESLADGDANNTVLSFTGSSGTLTATLTSSSGLEINSNSGSGRFATHGVKFLEADATDFLISFAIPIAAFAFSATDIGDFGGQLTLQLTRAMGGGTVDLLIPHTVNSNDGSAFFFGFTDDSETYSSARFLNSDDSDIFGFDEMVIADLQQVINQPTGGHSEAPIRSFILTDANAILSTLTTGIPMALYQRDFQLSMHRTALRDLNGRLFRLRAGWEAETPAVAAPHGKAPLGSGKQPTSSGKENVAAPAPVEDSDRWEVFAAGDFNSAESDDLGDLRGFEADTFSGTLGLEYSVNAHIKTGIGLTYVESDGELLGGLGNSEIQGAEMSAYTSVWRDPFYVDLLYSFGSYDNNLSRKVFGGPQAHGDVDSQFHTLAFNTGMNLKLGANLSTGPYLGLEYTQGELDAFTETGGGTSRLRYEKQKFDSFQTAIGWQISQKIPTRYGTVTPQLRVGYRRENEQDSDTIRLGLEQSPYYRVTGSNVNSFSSFEAEAERPSLQQDFMEAGAGIMWQPSKAWRMLLDYETNVFRGGYTAHEISLRVSYQF